MIKNALMYVIKNDEETGLISLTNEDFVEAIDNTPARDPEGSQWRSLGFTAPLSTMPDALTFQGASGLVYAIGLYAERILPASVINERVQERVNDIEDKEMRKAYRKERMQIKDDVVAELLPKSYIRRTSIPVIYHGPSGTLAIGTSSQKRADEILGLLRGQLGSLKAVPMTFDKPFETLFGMVKNLDSVFFSFAGDVKGKGHSDERISLTGVDLYEDEIMDVVDNCNVTEMRLTLREGDAFIFDNPGNEVPLLRFTLTATGVIKKIRLPDISIEKANQEADQNDGDQAALIDSMLALVGLTLLKLRAGFASDLMQDGASAHEYVAYANRLYSAYLSGPELGNFVNALQEGLKDGSIRITAQTQPVEDEDDDL